MFQTVEPAPTSDLLNQNTWWIQGLWRVLSSSVDSCAGLPDKIEWQLSCVYWSLGTTGLAYVIDRGQNFFQKTQWISSLPS